MSLTIACVWVQANVPYGIEYVERLAAMVARQIDRPHRFVCLTDRPWLVAAPIETMPIEAPGCWPGWWSKIELFRPGRFTGRVLYLDLDSLVVGALGPIVDVDAPFALIADHDSTFPGRDGRRVIKRFNSSVMVWTAGAAAEVWHTFTPAVVARLWGDQDHIAQVMPGAATFPAEWCPRLSVLDGQPPPATARVVLAKKPKNTAAAQQWPWFRAIWEAA